MASEANSEHQLLFFWGASRSPLLQCSYAPTSYITIIEYVPVHHSSLMIFPLFHQKKESGVTSPIVSCPDPTQLTREGVWCHKSNSLMPRSHAPNSREKKESGVTSPIVSCPDPIQLTRGEGVWCHKSNSLVPRSHPAHSRRRSLVSQVQ